MTKFTAFEVSKRVFNEHFEKKSTTLGNRGRVENLFQSGTMARGLDFRASIDLMFLAALDNEARKAGDLVLANKVQDIVEYAVDEMHKLIYIGTYATDTKWQNCLDVFYPIRAMAFIKFFMNGSKKGTPMMTKVDQIRMTCINRSSTLYETTVNSQLDKRIMKDVVKSQNKYVPSSGSGYIQPAAHLNVLSVLSSGLALNSYLVGNKLETFVQPTDYSKRQDIADIGNYLMAMCFGKGSSAATADMTRQSCNYGAAGEANKSEYVVSGYNSWVASNIALTAHGTVYPTNFWESPASVFSSHVPKMFQGFKDIVANKGGYLPATVKGFGADPYEAMQGTDYPQDTSAYLYNLAYQGDQTMIDWIDSVVKANANTGSKKNDVDIVAGQSVIECAIRRDTKAAYSNSGKAFFTRGVEGLAAGMFKRLSFND